MAHPGVRSLLAKFENNNQNNNTPSPPSRGRSPVGSDNSGSGRPLSKVRASFVAVDRDSRSPVSTLRKTSGRSDSPAAPSRVRSFNSEDLEGSGKSPVSTTPPSNDLTTGEQSTTSDAKEVTETPAVQNDSAKENVKPSAGNAPSSERKTPPVKPASKSGATPQKHAPAKTVTKRPSNINVSKGDTTKPASKSPNSRTSTSPVKPVGDRASRPTRSAKPTTTKEPTKEPAKAPTHKSSRASLNPAAKPASRPARSSTPANTKPATSNPTTNAKSTRLTSSSTTLNLSSAAKTGSTSGLSRKPSTLKSATSANQLRATTPTTRKQSSRSSQQSQSPRERPGSRVSSNGSSKPVDESFLARMMRPTASSASKVHDKVEVKSPPKASNARAPRKPLPKSDPRGSRLTKEKEASEKSQTVKQEPVAEEQKPEEETPTQPTDHIKEDVEPPVEALAEPVKEPVQPIVEVVEPSPIEKPNEEPVEASDKEANEAPAESVTTEEEKPTETPAEPQVEEVQQPTEAPSEQATDVVVPEPISSTKPAVVETAEASVEESNGTTSTELKEESNVDALADALAEKTLDDTEVVVPTTDSKPNDDKIDAEH